MKHVVKQQQPAQFQAWCASVRGTGDERYDRLPSAEKASLLASLIQEQASLCAYTMRRIAPEQSHVEHIKPQSRCRADAPGSDLDYGNLVACYPRDGMSRRCRYGAQAKDNWWSDDPNDFVSPLDARCESRFQFGIDGSIKPSRKHVGATKTIEVLRLDHPTLTEDRKRVIEEFIYGADRASPLRQQQATQAMSTICSRNATSPLVEFCVAIRDALEAHVKQIEKNVRKRNAIAGRRRRGR